MSLQCVIADLLTIINHRVFFAPSYIIQTDIFKTVFFFKYLSPVVISYDFMIIIILIIMILIIFITMMIAQHYCSDE